MHKVTERRRNYRNREPARRHRHPSYTTEIFWPGGPATAYVAFLAYIPKPYNSSVPFNSFENLPASASIPLR